MNLKAHLVKDFFSNLLFSLSFYWSNFLVQKINKLVHMNDNTTQNKKHIDIDIIDKDLMQNLVGIDVLIISTENWYSLLNPYIFLEGNQIIGRSNCDNVLGMTKHNLLAYAYKKVIDNVLKGILSILQFTRILLLKSFSLDHFRHKHFNNGGSCNFTMPLKILLYSHLMWMYNVQLEEI